MTDWNLPAPTELDAVLMPANTEVRIGANRWLIICAAVLTGEVHIHAVRAVGGELSTADGGTPLFRLFDAAGVEYPFAGGGGGGRVDGRPQAFSAVFNRPEGDRPTAFQLRAQLSPIGDVVDVTTFKVPE
ncbi:hypothetical protein [Prescottella equi]|uniref:hypothetical protein n=1 Tax=Rhodococcus hoagii TaxID=43767 RepID=UPI000A11310F|nr:hypothetical protein [Prescottella equi]ORM14138.1 hypothetical protein A5N77_03465 [Prescottella equi]